jgi:hypothetical protein
VQTDWLPADVYAPLEQFAHADRPVAGLYVPAAHDKQAVDEDWPAMGLYVPAVQAVHADWPAGPYVPDAQAMHEASDVCPAAEL